MFSERIERTPLLKGKEESLEKRVQNTVECLTSKDPSLPLIEKVLKYSRSNDKIHGRALDVIEKDNSLKINTSINTCIYHVFLREEISHGSLMDEMITPLAKAVKLGEDRVVEACISAGLACNRDRLGRF